MSRSKKIASLNAFLMELAVYAVFVVVFTCEPFWRERDKTVKPIPG